MATFQELVADPLVQSAAVIVGSIFTAWLIEVVISTTLVKAAKRTKTPLDDKIIEVLRRPVFLTVLLLGVQWSVTRLSAEYSLFADIHTPVRALLRTFMILIGSLAATRVGEAVLKNFAAKERKRSLLQTRTLPVFDICMRMLVVGVAIYFIFLAWHIDLTAWIASAGILGVAFGFAAKDTLANLFSGIFILADGPYKVKDWIVLDGDLRGEVTHIGIRSTRILTPDDVEITVPNAVIGMAQLLNETGGPYPRQRLRVPVSVAYGSDIDQVRAVLLEAIDGVSSVLEHPTPRTTFTGLGDSGLEFEVWVWILDPRVRERVMDQSIERIYKALGASKIEIPYPKRDVYLHHVAPPNPEPNPEPNADQRSPRAPNEALGHAP